MFLHDEDDATVHPITPYQSTSCDMRASILKTDAGHRLFARYRRAQHRRDLGQSIKHFERASDFCPVDHPCRHAAQFNLATAPVTQLHFAITLLSRFARRRFQVDADAAEELLSDVLDRDTFSPRPIIGVALNIRYDRQGNGQDLDEAIALLNEALVLYPFGLPDRHMSLVNLAAAVLTRFRHWGNDQDLDEAIVLERKALAFLPVGHLDRSALLNNLANALCA
ncbi:uncharacterized protein EDB91DRAFT_1249685 [Suillus paluster]|uniref:uncharacterized protein n=1 Tax=Suillus paluster TaxID=48578 RepID=UPI001B8723D1|nr:uncharacterized protein EDB91DRAFT_1249685 [Suillus paluster]KAG1737566.1 hypothetical protein EDB91DRAFT_1249685 [Suillus paluster]